MLLYCDSWYFVMFFFLNLALFTYKGQLLSVAVVFRSYDLIFVMNFSNTHRHTNEHLDYNEPAVNPRNKLYSVWIVITFIAISIK